MKVMQILIDVTPKKQLTIRLNPDIIDELKKIAENKSDNLNTIIEAACISFIALEDKIEIKKKIIFKLTEK